MSNEYQDKFPSFDGTNDCFRDKSADPNELGKLAKDKTEQKQDAMGPVAAPIREEVRM